MSRSRLMTFLLVFLGATPVAVIALWSLSRVATALLDPCAVWGQPSSEGMVSVQIGPQDPCKSRSFHGSKIRELTAATLVPGGILVFAILALAGAALSRRRLLLAAGIGMLAETLVVFTIAPLTLAVGTGFLLVARRVPPRL